jgi:hypothetical protein
MLSQEGARLLTESGPGTLMPPMRLTRVDEWASCCRAVASLLNATARGRRGAAAEAPHQPAGAA